MLLKHTSNMIYLHWTHIFKYMDTVSVTLKKKRIFDLSFLFFLFFLTLSQVGFDVFEESNHFNKNW